MKYIFHNKKTKENTRQHFMKAHKKMYKTLRMSKKEQKHNRKRFVVKNISFFQLLLGSFHTKIFYKSYNFRIIYPFPRHLIQNYDDP